MQKRFSKYKRIIYAIGNHGKIQEPVDSKQAQLTKKEVQQAGLVRLVVARY